MSSSLVISSLLLKKIESSIVTSSQESCQSETKVIKQHNGLIKEQEQS